MTRAEAQGILSLYRSESEDAHDPFFAEALQLAREDQELAGWFAAELSFDAAMTSKLAEEEVPARLRAALLESMEPRPHFQWTWLRALGLAAAAAMITLLFSLGLARPLDKANNLVENYRTEMVGFVDLPPALAMETRDLQKVSNWLGQNASVTRVNFPVGTRQLPALGCRALTFRGYRVGLACFRREGGQLVHLLIVDRAAFGSSELLRQREFQEVGEWATAIWSEDDKVYLLATKGNRQQLETYL